MNDQSHLFGEPAPATAFRFTGQWREFAPIALTNLLLTIVTLGIYRFWARARERRYLWSRTEFIDDTLEWTGTGGEMFKGFLIVMAALLPALLIFQFGVQALVLRGEAAIAGLLAAFLYLGIFFLTGVARYRALRYRLSRTWWHGIRGGGEPGGWGYGVSYLWRMIVGTLALGLLVPWAMTTLWNERWNAMSFGPDRFEASADTDGLMGRWVLLLVSPIIVAIPLVLVMGAVFALSGSTPQPSPAGTFLLGFGLIIAVYMLMTLIGIGYFAAYFRRAIGTLRLGGLSFDFSARSKDWLILFLGHVGLVVVTLGVGLIFISYRNWSFFIRHLEAVGEVELGGFTQSRANAGKDAEGLASAFDIGAI